MASPTLLQLRTRTRERANMENSTFVSDSELSRYINYSINDLRDKMIIKTGEEYFADIEAYTLVDGQEEYTLPTDFYKIISVQVLADDQLWFPLKRFEYAEQNEYARPLYSRVADLRYRIRGDKLIINPSTNLARRNLRLIYVPIPPELVNDNDTLQGFNGWDEYVVLLSAIKCLQKEEQDVSALYAELQKLDARMDKMMDNRDHSSPARVYDSSRMSRGAMYYL